MNKVVFADGTEIENASVSPLRDNQIIVSIPGGNISYAVSILNDPLKTKEITYCYSISKTVYKGYTQLNSVGIDDYDKRVRGYLNGTDVSVDQSYTVPDIYLPEELRNKKEEESDGNQGSEAT